MTLNARQKKILELARATGEVEIDVLAQKFDVTSQTIRRDINALCDNRLLERYHGGATLPGTVENLHYGIRQHVHSDSKEAIGRALAEQIPDNSSLFINVGTTTEAAGHALINRCNGLKIITNNLNVAIEASNKADFEVIVTGGRVRGADKAVVGASAVDMIEQFMVDFAIVGISGIDSTGNLLDFDYREVRVAQAILRNARTVYLLADSTKFGRNALVKMGHVSQLTALFTDQHPPKPIADLLDRHGVRVIVSGPTAP